MGTYKLTDPRLLAIAEMVRSGAVAADIGADHGHLICYLAESGIAVYGYACDIGEKPLSKAKSFIKAQGLEGVVEARLTNGLEGLPLDKITDVIIAGMGGEQIAAILGAGDSSKYAGLRFILQPMTKAERLRKYLCENGFALTSERGVAAGGFIYTVMAAEYSGGKTHPAALFYWTGLLPQSSEPDSAALLRRTAMRLRRIGEGLKTADKHTDALEYLELAAQIEDITEE